MIRLHPVATPTVANELARAFGLPEFLRQSGRSARPQCHLRVPGRRPGRQPAPGLPNKIAVTQNVQRHRGERRADRAWTTSPRRRPRIPAPPWTFTGASLIAERFHRPVRRERNRPDAHRHRREQCGRRVRGGRRRQRRLHADGEFQRHRVVRLHDPGQRHRNADRCRACHFHRQRGERRAGACRRMRRSRRPTPRTVPSRSCCRPARSPTPIFRRISPAAASRSR